VLDSRSRFTKRRTASLTGDRVQPPLSSTSVTLGGSVAICQCPVAYISFMVDDCLCLKAKYGLPPDFNQCPPEIVILRRRHCEEYAVTSMGTASAQPLRRHREEQSRLPQ
jgi:hypothetical protein